MDVEDLFGTVQTKEDKRVSVKDLLHYIFRKEEIEQKTILSNENINAIIKMNATNNYLEDRYLFRIEIFDKLIEDKRINVISYQGRGRKDIIDAVKAMQDNNIQLEDKKGLLG